MRRLLAFALLSSFVAVSPAQDGASILVRLESADEEVRDAAEVEWDELDEAKQVRLAREALTDPEAPGAIAAARRVSPWSLDLDEMSRQARALLRRPEIAERSLPSCIGGPEVLDVWRVAGEDIDWFEDLHRVTSVEHLPGLLDGAEDAPDAQWASRVWAVRIVAAHTDAHRERVAALFAEDLTRWPDVDLPRPQRKGSGLPPHFETLARCAWGLDSAAPRMQVLTRVVPWAWMLRWASEVAPTAADVEFLDDVVNGAEDDEEARAWALRHRVRLSGDGAVAWLTSLLGDEGPDCEAEISAHLAILGQPDAWKSLTTRDPDAATSTPLLWLVDRAAARQAAAQGAFDLGVQGCTRMRMFWGVDVSDADLVQIATHLADRATSAVDEGDRAEALDSLVGAYLGSFPDGLRGKDAARLARILGACSGDAEAVTEERLRLVLGLLEVRARDELVGLLRTWCAAGGWPRSVAINALLEIGEPVDVDLAWEVWLDERGAWADESTIGLHPDPAIATRLREIAGSDHDRADAAIVALARRAGLSRLAASTVAMFAGDGEETRDAVLLALVAGRAGVAVRDLFEATDERQLDLALDPGTLRDVRAQRENELYWRATLWLALSGAEGAGAEFERLLIENRTPILDDIAWPDDPRIGKRFARLHAERLAHSCCARFQAVTALKTAFPTMPVVDDWTLATQREIALDWLEAHEAELVFSKIANAWLPR